MITTIGEVNPNNLSRTINEINDGLPARKNQITPFNLRMHDKVMNTMTLRTRASFGVVVGNYITRYMREFVKQHGGTLYACIYFKDFIRKNKA